MIVYSLLGLSTILTFLIIFLFIQNAKLKKRLARIKQKPTTELSDFIKDAAKGQGFLAIRLDPEFLMYRSPRG